MQTGYYLRSSIRQVRREPERQKRRRLYKGLLDRNSSWLAKGVDRKASPLEEIGFTLVGIDFHGRSKINAAENRNREELAARENAIEILKIDGNQFDIRPVAGEVIKAAFEFTRFGAGIS